MEELRYTLALTMVRGVGSVITRQLIDTFGSAKNVFTADKGTLLSIPRIGQAIIEAAADNRVMDRADRELRFMNDHHIQLLYYGTPEYPQRLLECPDAPTVVYQLGQSVTGTRHALSIVGTRQCTQYGRDMTNRLVGELHEQIPDLVIISGLALGIDISAHLAALQYDVPTIAVVAHGLDRIYPSQHRSIASQIIARGGSIITEYPTGTQPERNIQNFCSKRFKSRKSFHKASAGKSVEAFLFP